MIQDSSKKVNKTHFHTDDFVDQVDQRIRVLLAQVRSIKKNHEAYTTAMRKATFEDKEKVDSILEHLQLDAAEDSGSGTSCTAIVPFRAQNDSQPSRPPASMPAAGMNESPGSPAQVFRRILSKQASTPNKEDSISTAKAQELVVEKSKPLKKLKPLGLVVGPMESSTEDDFEQKVPAPKAKGLEAIGKAKVKTHEKSYGLNAADLAMVASSLETKVKPVKGPKKKPACKKGPLKRPAKTSPGIATRSKDASRGSWPYYYTRSKDATRGSWHRY